MMIDCSGGMGFSREDIVEIINLLPASWIAGYVGYNSTKYDVKGDEARRSSYHCRQGRMDTQAIDD